MKFSHEHAMPNGLFMAHLDSVAVSSILIGEDKTGLPSFNGMQIPRIALTFASNEAEANKVIMLHFLSLLQNLMQILFPGSKEWTVNTILDWFKHILDVYYLKGRELTQEEEEALSLPFTDFDENGEYTPVDVEEGCSWLAYSLRISLICLKLVRMVHQYKTADGKNIPVWIKLIRYNKTVKEWLETSCSKW